MSLPPLPAAAPSLDRERIPQGRIARLFVVAGARVALRTRTVHVELLTDRGIHLLEWLTLHELAEVLHASRRTDVLFVAAPVRIVGATGSWIRPTAIT